MYAEVLQRTGFESKSIKSILPDKVHARKEVAIFLDSLPNKFRIVLNCFGTSRSRKLEKEKTFEIISTLINNIDDCTIVLMCYHSVKDVIKNWINEWDLGNVFCFYETESIFDSIDIVKTSNLVVTPDTVFVHIAEALDIPLISFYSDEEDNFNRWHPLEKTSVVGRYSDNINSCSTEVIANTLHEMKAILNS
jgi:ADP-heptose:LPS heptosyltransferase